MLFAPFLDSIPPITKLAWEWNPLLFLLLLLCYSILYYYGCFCCCWLCLHSTQGIFQNSNEREIKCFGKSEHTHGQTILMPCYFKVYISLFYFIFIFLYFPILKRRIFPMVSFLSLKQERELWVGGHMSQEIAGL